MNTALRRTSSAVAGSGLGTTIKYLQRAASGAAGNGWSQRSSTCEKQRAAPWATALDNDQVPARRRWHRSWRHD
jgi:hypothetical protein